MAPRGGVSNSLENILDQFFNVIYENWKVKVFQFLKLILKSKKFKKKIRIYEKFNNFDGTICTLMNFQNTVLTTGKLEPFKFYQEKGDRRYIT